MTAAPDAAAPRIALAGFRAAAGGAPPPYLGVRFDAARRPLRCAGNTLLAHLAPEDRGPFAAVGAALEAAGPGRLWAWLPPASLHMTLFDLVLHLRRDAGRWPDSLDLQATAAQADAWALDLARRAPARAPLPVRMRVEGLECSARSAGCVAALVTPEDPAQERRLRAFRDLWAGHAGLRRRPGHADYRFHVTLAYLVAWPDSAAEAENADAALAAACRNLRAARPGFTLCDPALHLFDDMTAFRPVHPV